VPGETATHRTNAVPEGTTFFPTNTRSWRNPQIPLEQLAITHIGKEIIMFFEVCP